MYDNPQPMFIAVVHVHSISLVISGRQFPPDDLMINFRECGVPISPGWGKGEFAHAKAGGLKFCYGIFILIDDDAAARCVLSGGGCCLEGDGRGQAVDEVSSFRKEPDIVAGSPG